MTELKRFRVFYCFDKSGRAVPAELAVAMDQMEISSKLLGELSENGGFIGLIDARDRTLQVAYDVPTGNYWIEIPSPDVQGSFGRHISFDQLTDLFKALPDELTPNAFRGFEFESWR
jgi:hypothetical protein